MGQQTTASRRVIGALFLGGALVLLIAGQTVLKSRLQNLAFLLYWSVCFILTGSAILVAFLDARAVQRNTRRDARTLLESTLNDIESDARHKPQPPHKNDPE